MLHKPQHPAAIALSLYPAAAGRTHLARVRLSQAGVPVPNAPRAVHVPLVVRLEPLVGGVVPRSVLPVVATLLLLLGVAARVVVPGVLRGVEEVGRRARREVEVLEGGMGQKG